MGSIFEGFNGTIFAYGQTGTGKTWSMEGDPDVPDLRGVIPNAFNHIFNTIGIAENKKFLVYASFLEIYNEEIRYLIIILIHFFNFFQIFIYLPETY